MKVGEYATYTRYALIALIEGLEEKITKKQMKKIKAQIEKGMEKKEQNGLLEVEKG